MGGFSRRFHWDGMGWGVWVNRERASLASQRGVPPRYSPGIDMGEKGSDWSLYFFYLGDADGWHRGRAGRARGGRIESWVDKVEVPRQDEQTGNNYIA